MHPQPRVRNKTKHTSVVTTVTPEITRHSPRNGFTAYFALSSATRLCCHRRLRIWYVKTRLGLRTSARLDASIGASEPHDFTVREQRLSSACHSSAHGPCRPALPSPDIARRCRVHRIPPRVRDDRDTPLEWDETVRLSELICLGPKQKYFCKRGWTGKLTKHELICPSSGKSTACFS